MSQSLVFWISAPIALGAAIGIVMNRNAVHSALFLVLNLMALAVLFVDLDAQFLGIVQIIVYAGAIMVLFLFVIMLLGVDRQEVLDETLPIQRVGAGILGLAMALGLVLVLRRAFAGTTFTGLAEANQAGNVQAIGRLLFRRYLWPFEVTSILLVVAAIGAMILGRSHIEEEVASEVDAHATTPVRPLEDVR